MRWAVAVCVLACGCGRMDFDALTSGGTDPDAGSGSNDAPSGLTFRDDFDRGDSAAIGNNWIELTPGTFAITGDQVTRVPNGDWTRNQVYRPSDEDIADLEVSMEFVVSDVNMPDWPQVFVRGMPSSFAGYYVWLELGPGTAGSTIDLARKGAAESWWTGLDSDVAPPAIAGERYRLRLAATGANPVSLTAHYERNTGPDQWDEVITLTASDSDPNAITSAGTWGFDGHVGTVNGPYTYDNFAMIAN